MMAMTFTTVESLRLLSSALFAPVLGSILIASVWQGLLMAAGTAVVLRILRSASPAERTALLAAMLCLLVVLPLVSTWHARGIGEPGPLHVSLRVTHGWTVALLWMWAGLSVRRLLWLGRGAVRACKIVRGAKPAKLDARVELLLHGGPRWTMRSATAHVSPELNRPSILGFFRPRVLLPEGLLETLSHAELEHVVLHEMEHLRRFDDWLNLLQQVSLVLMPWNPALLWLDRRLCVERELACDDGVLRKTASRTTYAGCLVKLAEASLVRQGIVLAMSALGTRARKSELLSRVQRILAGRGDRGAAGRPALTAGALAVAVLSAAGWMALQSPAVHFDTAASSAPQEARMVPVSAGLIKRATATEPLRADAGIERDVVYRVPATLQRAHATLPATALPNPHAGLPVTRPVALRHRKGSLRLMRTTLRMREAGSWPVGPERAALTRWTRTGYVSLPSVYAAVPFQGGWLVIQL